MQESDLLLNLSDVMGRTASNKTARQPGSADGSALLTDSATGINSWDAAGSGVIGGRRAALPTSFDLSSIPAHAAVAHMN